MKKICIILLSMMISVSLFSKELVLEKIIAWPNPFNSKTQNLTIEKIKVNGPGFTGLVEFTIYDFNLKQVFSGSGTGKLKWNGFDKNNKRLHPGIYFIKVVEVNSDGAGSLASDYVKVIIK